MHLMVKFIFLVVQVCAIASSVVLQGSSGEKISPSQATFYVVSHRVTQEEQITSNSSSPTSQPNTSPHFESAPSPQVVKRAEPSLSPNTPLNEPPHVKDHVSPPFAAAPVSFPSEGSPPNPPMIQPTIPVSVPPIPQEEKRPASSPVYPPIVSVEIAPPPKEVMQNPPPMPQVPPSMPQGPPLFLLGPMASPPRKLPIESPPIFPTLPVPPPSNILGPVVSPTLPIAPPNLPVPPPRNSAPSPRTSTVPPPAIVASPPSNLSKNLQPIQHNSSIPPSNLPEPHVSPVSTPPPSIDGVPVSSPPNRTTNIAPAHHSPVKAPSVHKAPPPLIKTHPSPLYPPPPGPKRKPWHYAPPPPNTVPFISPKISPSRSSPRIQKMPIQALPPPPPNEDCLSITCKEPLTNTPPGTPCNCVMPMQIELGLSVALYTFFPLVSELALEIASGVFMKSSQVRIMGANADNQDPEKTIVIVDLVPLGQKFDSFTAYLTAQRLWLKQVAIKSSLFGDYQVVYVKYPGLPPSPPLPSSSTGMNNEPYGHGNDARAVKPLGIDVIKQTHSSNKLNGGIVAIIALSAVVAVVLFGVIVWVLIFKRRHGSRFVPTPPTTLPSLTKSSGSGPTSTSLSFGSSIAFTGSAKTFSSSDIEKITDEFSEAGVLGEGGFGRVYSGELDDGTKVAVKVLKRDDQQGGREFLAEVEMLSRLHHRNLVTLIGICTEERTRCLVYELVPNGSVESHLHGIDKETGPLDWGARLKIALGAARGLAYLHEDSSPRVIHRDFKSSNILLEHDFTPKVSDFGLARTALDEENTHISTRVMGTFGYVAPEYAMTGHLLVKSDVYSYGVVLLELLTGRKPVDMSMPPGQENLVAWARPLLPNPEDLNLLIDPSLWANGPVDSISKVAAIASMCVQPEVSHRPFMGEVVQALKLVRNECEETRDLGSRTCSQDDLTSVDFDFRVSTNSGPGRPTVDMESGFSGSGLGLDYRMGSSSGPLRTGRRVQLWERMKRFSGGSVSEHGDFLRLLSRSR